MSVVQIHQDPLPYWEYKTKAVTKIVLITKNEMEYLTKVKGIPFGYEGVSHTYGHNRTYYLCEKHKKLLENYRKSRIVEK